MKTIIHTFFNRVRLFLSMSWHYVHQRWNLLPSWCCHCQSNINKFASLILCNSRICYLRNNSSQRKELLWLTPHKFPPFSNWGVWMSKQTSWCVLTQLCQCHVELQRTRRLSSFCLGYFSLSKNFNSITKDASIFHLKSGDSDRCSYFSTSTPSKHIPPSPRLTSYTQLVVEIKKFWYLICVNFTSYKLTIFLIFFFPCTFSRFAMCLLIKFCRVNTLNIIGDIKMWEQIFVKLMQWRSCLPTRL
jgi:hypothetical protein